MYNLDVANQDNFYVGEQGWLVHNGDKYTKYGFSLQSTGGGQGFDFASNGFHINSSKLGEMKVLFENGTIQVSTLRRNNSLSNQELKALKSWMFDNSVSVINQLSKVLEHTSSASGLSGTNLRNL